MTIQLMTYLEPDIVLQNQFKRWSFRLAGAIVLLGLMVLMAWLLGLGQLYFNGRRFVQMNPLTAVCFITLAAAYWLLNRHSRTTGPMLCILVALVAFSKVIEWWGGPVLYLDQVLFYGQLRQHTPPNQMAPNTAIGLLIVSAGLLLLNVNMGSRHRPAHYLAFLLFILSLASLLGYLYQVEQFYGIMTYIPMSVFTALGFFLFSLVLFFQAPDKGFMQLLTNRLPGSNTARLLVPAAIIIPAVLGLMRLWGTWEGVYTHESGVVFYSLSITIIFLAIIFYHTYQVNQREGERLRTEEALQISEQQIRNIFTHAPDAVVVMDNYGRIDKWNNEAERLFGWTAKEALGQPLKDLIMPAGQNADIIQYIDAARIATPDDTIDLRAEKKDGSSLDVALRISPLQLKDSLLFVGFIRDITERKQVENRLKSFNEELALQVRDRTREIQEIFERVTDGFIALDNNFYFTYVNQRAGEILHRDPVKLTGKNIWEEFPEMVNSPSFFAYHKALATQQHLFVTDQYEPLDLWHEDQIYASANGLSVFLRDISEKMKSEKAVREAEALADKLIDSLPGVFYFYDADGKFIRWNRRLEEVTGYSGEEIAAMHPIELFPDDEKEYIAGRINTVFETGANDAEASFISRTGERTPYHFKAVLVDYKGGPCLLGTGIDIRERKQAEQELRESEQKYKLLFQSNPLPMWMLSLPDYDIIEVNHAALVQYQYEREEFLALDIMNLRPEEDRRKLEISTNRNFRGLYHAGVWRHSRKDESIIYVNITTHDIIYEGKPVRLVLADEMTEQYLAEEKLRESYASIRELTEYLQNVREEERLNISREIHDELGQLLTVLKMDVSWINRKIEEDNAPVKNKIGEVLSLIDNTVTTVRRIASELRPSLLDNLGLLAAMEWHVGEFEKRSGIKKYLSLPETEVPLPDPVKIGLFRIMQESLTNVGRHSGATEVTVTLTEENESLILVIQDNGHGFDPGKPRKKTLGLLGMRERAEVMGGSYEISSRPGEGTTVNVTVPVKKEIIAT